MFNTIVGASYLIVSCFLFFINVVLMLAIHKTPNYKTCTFKIVQNICIACIMQLVPFMVGGIMTLSNSMFSYYLDRIMGIFIESGWFLYIALSLTLAVDRLIIFTRFRKLQTHVAIFLFANSWLFWLASVIILSLPDFGYTYSITDDGPLAWGYYRTRAGAILMADVEPYIDLCVFGIVFVVYCVVVFLLFETRNAVRSESGSSSISKLEYRILFTAIISFLYETSFAIYSFWAIPFPVERRNRRVFMNLFWMIDSGLFALIALVTSRRFRRKVLDVMFIKIFALSSVV